MADEFNQLFVSVGQSTVDKITSLANECNLTNAIFCGFSEVLEGILDVNLIKLNSCCVNFSQNSTKTNHRNLELII